MLLRVAHDFLPKRNSVRAAFVMDHFGIGFEQGRRVVANRLEVAVRPGDVVLFTGASGSGKSSLLGALAASLTAESAENTPLSLEALPLPETLLIEALPVPVREAMGLLSSCGLGEAQLMLRTPAELSDGQRYRFRLALALARKPRWIAGDEFTAALDRTLAKVIAFNVRRLSRRTGTGFLLATTHDDVSEDLTPDVHIHCRLDGEITVTAACRLTDRFPLRKPSPSPRSSGSPPRPEATGRTSLGGITGAITSGPSGA